jgi:peptidoglycan/LPS O-acetylase OafA/YrhL
MKVTTSQAYRPDIDGLRAVAVLLVVAYHVRTRFTPGGFIGVDVFFVISGFLITSILIRELDGSRFSIQGFYVRRIRRIGPALIAVVVGTSIFAFVLLLPSELKDYARSLLAALGSASNFYFWSQTGYFKPEALTMPLLHTWSLAVEEQFYIIFPAVLALLYRYARRSTLYILLVLAAASFALSARQIFSDPSAAFYWPTSRAWELLSGSLLVFGGLPGMKYPLLRNVTAAIGLILVIFAAATYTKSTPFPGVAALAPCMGAVFIIGSGSAGKTIVGQALSRQPLVFIGLISYSLYLWHWPVIVFQSMGLNLSGVTANQQKAFTVALSILLASLSWRFIELPFRRNQRVAVPATVFRFAALGASVPAAAACLFLVLNGVPSRFPVGATAVASYLEDAGEEARNRTGSCLLTETYTFQNFDRAACLSGSRSLPNYLILGDSHAAHLWYGLSHVVAGANFLQATASGCKPTITQALRQSPQCVKLIDFALRDYLPKSHIKAVILGGHWTVNDLDHLSETIKYVRGLGITPIVLGPVVEYDAPLPRLLAISIGDSDLGLPQRHKLSSVRDLDRSMSALARDLWHVGYFSYFEALCTNGQCREYVSAGVPMQKDTTHLTGPGSIWIAEQIEATQLLR